MSEGRIMNVLTSVEFGVGGAFIPPGAMSCPTGGFEILCFNGKKSGIPPSPPCNSGMFLPRRHRYPSWRTTCR